MTALRPRLYSLAFALAIGLFGVLTFVYVGDGDGDGNGGELDDLLVLCDTSLDAALSATELLTCVPWLWTAVYILLAVLLTSSAVAFVMVRRTLKAEEDRARLRAVQEEMRGMKGVDRFRDLVVRRRLSNLEQEVEEQQARYQALVAEQERLQEEGLAANVDTADISFDAPRLLLGEGGFGMVFRSAVGGFHGTTVAIKVAKGEESAGAREEFLREGALLASLHHDNVVGFRGIGTLDGRTALVLEYVEESLEDVVHVEGHLNSKDRLGVLRGIAAACAYLHAHLPNPIIHRDLKPGNVLLAKHSGGWRPKVTDYGLSSFGADEIAQVGTLVYMAPELFGGHQGPILPAGAKPVDVYAFGIMMVDVIGRSQPWLELSTRDEVQAAVLAGDRPTPPPPLASATGALQLAKQCWDQRPEVRPSFKDVLARLIELDGHAQAAPVPRGYIDGQERVWAVGDLVRLHQTHPFGRQIGEAAASCAEGFQRDEQSFTVHLTVEKGGDAFPPITFTERPSLALAVVPVIEVNHYAELSLTVDIGRGEKLYVAPSWVELVTACAPAPADAGAPSTPPQAPQGVAAVSSAAADQGWCAGDSEWAQSDDESD